MNMKIITLALVIFFSGYANAVDEAASLVYGQMKYAQELQDKKNEEAYEDIKRKMEGRNGPSSDVSFIFSLFFTSIIIIAIYSISKSIINDRNNRHRNPEAEERKKAALKLKYAENTEKRKQELKESKLENEMNFYKGFDFERNILTIETIGYLEKEKKRLTKIIGNKNRKTPLEYEPTQLDDINRILSRNPTTEALSGFGIFISTKNPKGKIHNFRLLTSFDCKMKWFSMKYEKINCDDEKNAPLLSAKIGHQFELNNIKYEIISIHETAPKSSF